MSYRSAFNLIPQAMLNVQHNSDNVTSYFHAVRTLTCVCVWGGGTKYIQYPICNILPSIQGFLSSDSFGGRHQYSQSCMTQVHYRHLCSANLQVCSNWKIALQCSSCWRGVVANTQVMDLVLSSSQIMQAISSHFPVVPALTHEIAVAVNIG